MSETKIPESFATPEEEARFWDETDLTDLASGELEEVEMRRPSKPLSSTFAIRLDQRSGKAISKAKKRRDARVAAAARARETSASVSEQRRETKDASA